MSELGVQVVGAVTERYAAVPTITLQLRLAETSGLPVKAVALRAQVRIEPQHRRYDGDEQARLVELFGEGPQWGESLRPFLWTEISKTIGAFRAPVEVDLPVTCTYDMEVAAARYFGSLAGGEVPLLLLFSGTVFRTDEGRLVVEPVPWHLEARFRLPVACWRETMERYFPHAGWIRLGRETLDALAELKAREALPSFERTVQLLLERAATQALP